MKRSRYQVHTIALTSSDFAPSDDLDAQKVEIQADDMEIYRMEDQREDEDGWYVPSSQLQPSSSHPPRPFHVPKITKGNYNEDEEPDESGSGTATPASRGQDRADDPLFLPGSSQLSSQPVDEDDLTNQRTRRKLGGITEDQLARMVVTMRVAGRRDKNRLLAKKFIAILYGISLEAVADWCDSNM